MAAIIEADPAPLPQTIPAPLRWIVERCLAKDPSARYTSTRDLYHELLSLRDHISEAMTVSESSLSGSARKPRRRWPIAATAILGAFAIAATGYLLGWYSRPASAAPTAVVLTSSGGVVLNPSFSPDGSQVVFAWGPGNYHHNLYLKLIGSFDLLRLTKGDADDVSPAWAPDGKQIAFVRSLSGGGRALMLISPLGGSERKLTELGLDYFGSEEHSLLAWTPDGSYLAAAKGRQLDLVSAETGEHRFLTFEASAILGDADPAFSPDGKRIAFVRRLGPFTSRLLWFPLNAQYLPAAQPKELQTPGVVAFSPLWEANDRLLLAAGAPFGMHLFRTTVPVGRTIPFEDAVIGGSLTLHRKTGRLIYTSPLSIQNLHRLAVEGPGRVSHSPERVTSTTGSDLLPHYSPDGASLVFASYRFGQFGIWAVPTEAPQGSLLAAWGDGLVVPSDWSPDGKSVLMFATGPQGMYQLYRVAVDTRKVTRLLDQPSHDIYPTYSRDGRSVYFTSAEKQSHLMLYKMPAAGGPLTVALDRSVVRALESADGRWLYFTEYAPGGICRMPLKGGEITRVVEHVADPFGWELAGAGIYYWAGDQSTPDLHYMDLETRQDHMVFRPSVPAVPQLAISPDGRWLCFSLIERNSQELMLVEKLR